MLLSQFTVPGAATVNAVDVQISNFDSEIGRVCLIS